MEIRYARSGVVSIAYQVVGDGPLDLVVVHGWVCTFFPGWENPKISRFYRRLAQLGRLILFDKRGTGLSDRVSANQLPDLDTDRQGPGGRVGARFRGPRQRIAQGCAGRVAAAGATPAGVGASLTLRRDGGAQWTATFSHSPSPTS